MSVSVLKIRKDGSVVTFLFPDEVNLTGMTVDLVLRDAASKVGDVYPCAITGATTATFDPSALADEPVGRVQGRLVVTNADGFRGYDNEWFPVQIMEYDR